MTPTRRGPQGCTGRADAGVSMRSPLSHHSRPLASTSRMGDGLPQHGRPGLPESKGVAGYSGGGRARQQDVNRELELVKRRRHSRGSGGKGMRGTARLRSVEVAKAAAGLRGSERASPGANGSAGHDVLHERWKEEESGRRGFSPRRPRWEPSVPAPPGPAPLGPPS